MKLVANLEVKNKILLYSILLDEKKYDEADMYYQIQQEVLEGNVQRVDETLILQQRESNSYTYLQLPRAHHIDVVFVDSMETISELADAFNICLLPFDSTEALSNNSPRPISAEIKDWGNSASRERYIDLKTLIRRGVSFDPLVDSESKPEKKTHFDVSSTKDHSISAVAPKKSNKSSGHRKGTVLSIESGQQERDSTLLFRGVVGIDLEWNVDILSKAGEDVDGENAYSDSNFIPGGCADILQVISHTHSLKSLDS